MSKIALLVWVTLAAPAPAKAPVKAPVMAPVMAAPVMAAPVMAAPVMAAPVMAPVMAPAPTPAPASDPHAGHNHGPAPAAPRGPVTNDPSDLRLWISFRVMAIENGKIYLSLTYSVQNNGTKTFHPGNHGLLLPMPVGAKGVSVPRGTRGASVSKGKILVLRPVRTGRHGLRIQAACNLPYDSPQRLMELRSTLPLIGYSVSIKKYPTVRINAKGLDKPESFKHGESDTPWLVYRARADGFPRNQIGFSIQGLPVRSRAGAWLFGGLALLLVLAAIGLTVARGRRSRRSGSGDEDSLADQLVRIERDRLLGVIDDAGARQFAEACLAGAQSAADKPISDKKAAAKSRKAKKKKKR